MNPSPPSAVVELIRRGVLDAELAAMIWLLLEARVSIIVAGAGPHRARGAASGRADRIGLADALLGLVPRAVRRVPIDRPGTVQLLTAADASTTCLVGLDLADAPVPHVRLAFRSLSRGTQIVASAAADSLEEVLARLRASDLRLTDDELSFAGVVVVLRRVGGPGAGDDAASQARRDRVIAAHYLRPLARDPRGHLQRLGPAVLATWDATTDSFEHFSWGIAAELADRIGLRPGDLEVELGRRRDRLAGPVAAGGV